MHRNHLLALLRDYRPRDIDVHSVPATPTEPRHEHYDIRFLVELDDRLHLPGNDESHEVAWVPLHQVMRLNNMRSMNRMVQKSRAWQDAVARLETYFLVSDARKTVEGVHRRAGRLVDVRFLPRQRQSAEGAHSHEVYKSNPGRIFR